MRWGNIASLDFISNFEQRAWDAKLLDPDTKVLLLAVLNANMHNRLDVYVSFRCKPEVALQ